MSKKPFDLSYEKKALLHLIQHMESGSQHPAYPPELTQPAIAGAVGIPKKHLPRQLKLMMKKGLLEEMVTHVKGAKQRRKVYVLTQAGMGDAHWLLEGIKSEKVACRDKSGKKTDMTVSEVLKANNMGQKAILDVINALDHEGVFNLGTDHESPAKPRVETILQGVPDVDNFVDRTRERSFINEWLDGDTSLLAVYGIAGIGKTALVAKAIREHDGTGQVFWLKLRTPP